GTASPVTQTFSYQVTLDETTNSGACMDCPYHDLPGFNCNGCGSGTGGPCPDYVTVPSTFDERTVTIDGRVYTLQIVGFKKTGETAVRSYFITQERCTNTADLYAKLIELNPQINITKKTNGMRYTSGPGPTIPGGCTIAWTYTVTNPGNVPLSSVTVTDDRVTVPSDHTGDTNNDGKLDPGEVWVYTATGTASSGQHSNKATATGSFASVQVQATDWSYYYGCTPVITLPSPSICDGQATSLDLESTVTGCTGVQSYRWFKGDTQLSDGSKYSGTATSKLTIKELGVGDSGSYRVEATFYTGCTISKTAVLAVNPRPAVSISTPNSQLNCTGPCPIIRAVTGNIRPEDAVYTWYKDGQVISGETGSSIQPCDPGSYTVTVSNRTSGCSASSSELEIKDKTYPDCSITAPGTVCPDSKGNTASVPDAGTGASYSWT
ncbi:MAG: choice-of-anchor K domain-containing protein, partial [Methanothrix sp.]|nr:choice-of-anchor K domain-containing protein [Methanothrix sp.]